MTQQDGMTTLFAALRVVVGARNVIVGRHATNRYARGYRFGRGEAGAVVRPGSLTHLWRVVRLCVEADVIVIMQAANTGLTGGSTPRDQGYDRPVVIVNVGRLAAVHIINGGRQVICLPGATLHELERKLAPLGRQPHSVIGSSCIGASVIGGICNNSGGALIQRGPAFTQLALYAQATGDGVHLVNHLGVDLGDDPETLLDRLERGDFADADVTSPPCRRASDDAYASHIREIDQPTPARYNADPSRLFEASGCAGRICVFAVRLDTFPQDGPTLTYYVGSNDPDALQAFRRDMLSSDTPLPISAEYIHRTAFDIAASYGKDMFLAIRYLGTHHLPRLFALKAGIDRVAERLGERGAGFSDRIMQWVSRLFPAHLPARMRAFRDRFEHHLIVKVARSAAAQTETLLARHCDSPESSFFTCTQDEARDAFLHRFAVAGAAVRYRSIHKATVADIVALDIAFPRNMTQWVERLPEHVERQVIHKLYYGHFFCHVFHHDYVIAACADLHVMEKDILAVATERGGQCPAEHNVGHLYAAPPHLANFYRDLDPRNIFNPGIGLTSAAADWAD